MHSTQAILLEESIQIAWDYLEKSGQLGEPSTASHILHDEIAARIEQGEINRLVLSNMGISVYLKRQDTDCVFKDQCGVGCDTSE